MKTRRLSLEGKLGGLLFLVFALGATTGVWLWRWLGDGGAVALGIGGAGLAISLLLARPAVRRIRRLLRALQGAVASD